MIIINWIGNHITLTADMSRPSFKTENIQIAPELSTLQKRTSTKKILSPFDDNRHICDGGQKNYYIGHKIIRVQTANDKNDIDDIATAADSDKTVCPFFEDRQQPVM